MSSKHIGSDVNYAYPTAEIAVMGSEGAVNILYKNSSSREQNIEDYKQKFANPYRAAELGYVDEIIDPKKTRFKLIQAIEMTRNKTLTNPHKKHGNIPL